MNIPPRDAQDTQAPSCPVHQPDFLRAQRQAEKAVGHVLWLSAIAMLTEIVAGHLTGSMALLADGWHMATHVAAMGISAFAYVYMRRHAGQAHYSFGPGKVSYLAAYSSSLLLAGVALAMLYEAASRLQAPQDIHYDEALAVAVLGLIVNLLSAWLLHGNDHDHDGDEHAHEHANGHADQNLRAAYVHVLADAITSVAAIVALIAGKWAGIAWLDPVMAALGGVLILRWAWRLAGDSAGVLLDRQIDSHLLHDIHACLARHGVRALDLHLWLLAPGRHALLLTLAGSPELDVDRLRHELGAMATLAHVTLDIVSRDTSSVAPQQSL
ncbi:CDF family Co(II)/Ni(II) efflux transporter DmeF [Methyloversatilis sp. XJ19-13]|uniref:CDF family Co(II)/Ni(II) efflux transporter DmeF n=1 Tax=Methyloversatilis sp. XJ19-13 TaxID=2963430 RepID=UPI00211C81F2|nr:CDF family Co(II)/Ni(II) efflux transporter DmeF [Methyloversatilis sp. XJ19-13]MCQ9374161.1 CDF family Co(II)/Ni(II) efflux transporter DmeF [Methyloversatilis sp. XJ19-13]